jgi:hypothetical protein
VEDIVGHDLATTSQSNRWRITASHERDAENMDPAIYDPRPVCDLWNSSKSFNDCESWFPPDYP